MARRGHRVHVGRGRTKLARPLGDPKPENHVAFEVSYEDMLDAQEWLEERGIEKREPQGADHNPFVRPHQGNASLYFEDPDGNSLEFLAWLPEGQDEEWEAKLSLEECVGIRDTD